MIGQYWYMRLTSLEIKLFGYVILNISGGYIDLFRKKYGLNYSLYRP